MAIWETENIHLIKIIFAHKALIRIIRARFDPEIRDQLWILDRVYQMYPSKNFFFFFFYCDFGCAVALR